MFKCYICRNEFSETSGQIMEEEFVCQDCFWLLPTCDNCGTLVLDDYSLTKKEDCSEQEFDVCSYCAIKGSWRNEDDNSDFEYESYTEEKNDT